jgi:hypothetical protein
VLPPLDSNDAQLLDGKRRKRPNLTLPTDPWLLHRLHRVVANPPPLDRPPQDALEKSERPVDRRLPNSIGVQFGTEAFDSLWRDRVESHRAKSRQHMSIPKAGVAAESPCGQVGRGIELPPIFGEVSERLPSAGQQVQVAGSLPPDDFRVEGIGVPLSPNHFRARPALLVAPAHPPDRAALPLNPFNAHDDLSPSSSMARRLPR